MSEDEQIPFNNRTHDRLTELEKKIKDLEDMQETIVETDPVLLSEKIEKLEKIEIENQLSNIRVIANKREEHTIKELSELVINTYKGMSELDKEIKELKDEIWKRAYARMVDINFKDIKEVLRELMGSWKRFIHFEKTGVMDNAEWNALLEGFKLEISKLEDKLGGETSVAVETSHNGNGVQNNSSSILTDSKPLRDMSYVSQIANTYIKRENPSEQECEHAWSETLDNKQICSFCGKEEEPTEDWDFYEVKTPKPEYIPKDIDDYFRGIPNDLPRIKYDRLLETLLKFKLVETQDLEFLFEGFGEESYQLMGTKTVERYYELKEKYLDVVKG